jgi:hypothetical protein
MKSASWRLSSWKNDNLAKCTTGKILQIPDKLMLTNWRAYARPGIQERLRLQQ